jgi:NAD-dependent deacetylase
MLLSRDDRTPQATNVVPTSRKGNRRSAAGGLSPAGRAASLLATNDLGSEETVPAGKRIVILTGAGISAESGIATFRDKDGIWSKVDYREVATPEGFARNPQKVLDFYNMRRKQSATARPNAAHLALARLEHEHDGPVLLVTQNVDSLHEAAGSRNLLHMHGEHGKVLCNHCGARAPWGHNQPDLTRDMRCAECNRAGGLRPDVVWFGEMPYHMEQIEDALQETDLFVSIGTSGNVYPAAGFVSTARRSGAYTIELNLEPSEGATLFHQSRNGLASVLVPAFVEKVLAGEF